MALAPTFATSKASGHPHSAEAAYTYLCRFVNAHYVYTLVGTLAGLNLLDRSEPRMTRPASHLVCLSSHVYADQAGQSVHVQRGTVVQSHDPRARRHPAWFAEHDPTAIHLPPDPTLNPTTWSTA